MTMASRCLVFRSGRYGAVVFRGLCYQARDLNKVIGSRVIVVPMNSTRAIVGCFHTHTAAPIARAVNLRRWKQTPMSQRVRMAMALKRQVAS